MKDGGAVAGNEWQGKTGASWAAEWQQTDRSFAPLTGALLDRAGSAPFQSFIDIGCGAGDLALALAAHSPAAHAVGLDISAQLIAIARNRSGHNAHLAFEIGDAASWLPSHGFRPDLLVSRHGVMFFDDPAGAFRHLHDLLADDGRLLFSCFRPWNENPVFRDIAALLPGPVRAPDPSQPGPFAFGDADRVDRILRDAGWGDVTFEPLDFSMVLGEGSDAVDQAIHYFTHIGVASRAMRDLEQDARHSLIQRIRDFAAGKLEVGIVSLPAACWIVSANR